MNRIKPITLIFVAFIAVLGLASCSGTDDEGADIKDLEKLADVQAVVREEGSGTREVFEETIGITRDGKGADKLRKDVLKADSGDEVIQQVEKNVSAIGYVSEGSITEDEKVKAISVDGIKPDKDNIKSGDYELTRTFYVAYQGELNDLEMDFMSYVKGVGQNTVAQNHIAVGKTGEDIFLSVKQEGTITIKGSTSVAPLIRELADEYEEYNPNAKIVIEESDSTKGINDAMQGKCDMAMVSRELKSYEKELMNYDAIAREAIAIIVNDENPIKDINMDQIKEIYDGTIKQWMDLNKK